MSVLGCVVRAVVSLPQVAKLAIRLGIGACLLAMVLGSLQTPAHAKDTIDIGGTWHSIFGFVYNHATIGFVYNIVQDANNFKWSVENPEEVGQGTIVYELDIGYVLRVEWHGENGSGSDSGVVLDAGFRVLHLGDVNSERQPEFILWNNGNLFFRNRTSADKHQYTSGEAIKIFFEAPTDAGEWEFADSGIRYTVLDSDGAQVKTWCIALMLEGPLIQPGKRYQWEWDQTKVVCDDAGGVLESSLVPPGAYTVIVDVIPGYREPGRPLIMQHSAEIEVQQQVPSILLLKSGRFIDSDRDGMADEGERAAYEFTVTNTGNVTLSNISLSDDTVNQRISLEETTLAPGRSTSVKATYTVTQADMDAGHITNSATATARPPGGGTVTDSVTELVNLPQRPRIDLSKVASSIPDVDAAGATITYSYTVTNTGNVTLSNISLSDDTVNQRISLEETTLAPGRSTSVKATYTVTQADMDAGHITNTATAKGRDLNDFPVAVSTSFTLPLPQNPIYTISVAVTDVDRAGRMAAVDATGDVIKYQIVVRNTGNQSLTELTVTTSLPGDLDDPTESLSRNSILDVEETWIYTSSYVVRQSDIDDNGGGDGDIDIIATVTSTMAGDESERIEVPISSVRPELMITKLVTGVDETGDGIINHAGEAVDYQFMVTNTDNQTLTGVSVVASLPGLLDDVDKSLNEDEVLDVGETWTYSGSYIVQQADIDDNGGGDGDIDNTATVSSNELPDKSVTASVQLRQNPLLSTAKVFTHNSDEDDSGDITLGDTLRYTITVTNPGNVTLAGVAISDDFTGESWICSSVAPGQTCGLVATHVVRQDDIDALSIVNTAIAKVALSNGRSLVDSDTVTIHIPPTGPNPGVVAAIVAGALGVVVGAAFCVRNATRWRYERSAKAEEPTETCDSPGRYCFKQELEVEPDIWKVGSLALFVKDPISRSEPAKRHVPRRVTNQLNAAIDAARGGSSSDELRGLAETIVDSILKQVDKLVREKSHPIEVAVDSYLEDGSCKYRFTPYVCKDSRWVEKKAWEKEIKVQTEEHIADLRVPYPGKATAGDDLSAVLTESLVRFIRRVVWFPIPSRERVSEEEGSDRKRGAETEE